jgi:hypothetical protein
MRLEEEEEEESEKNCQGDGATRQEATREAGRLSTIRQSISQSVS